MNSTIEEIYYKFSDGIKTSKQYWAAQDQLILALDRIVEKLPEEFKSLIREIELPTGDMEAEQTKTYFIEGFKMGMRTAIEALKE